MGKSISIRAARNISDIGDRGLLAARTSDMRHKYPLAFIAAVAASPLGSAIAQVSEGGPLPLSLAVKAATKAIATCAGNGYPVSAVVVDHSGVIKLEAKGDHSNIHTTIAGYHKAYTF
jgi:hypothetical protein